MLIIRTRLGPSKIHGIGLFADEFIPKGVTTWRFTPGFDQCIDPDYLLKLSEHARKLFWHYAYVDKKNNHYVLCGDDERFLNHSEHPNILQKRVGREAEGREVAAIDIQAGEELTVNYYDFDRDAERKLKGLGVYGGQYNEI